MAFESFPNDSFRAYEDPGIYYVNENGKLRSPPGMASKKAVGDEDWLALHQSPPGIINRIFLSNRHQTVSKMTRHDGTDIDVYNPKKLFDISLMFVADNIHLVESLVDFPDIVGEQLFNAVMELGKFQKYQTAMVALKLFYEAYGSAVLETLRLRDRHVVFSNRLDCVLIFTGLRALDLGGCGIGNEDEILSVIGNMNCLQDLCLCDNRLSDDALQKMTTPLRMLGRGPKELCALDLSGNPLITNFGVRFLSAYASLRRLDLSGCSVSKQGITIIQSKLPTLRAAHTDEERSKFPIAIGNQGWAVPVVQNWLSLDAGVRQEKQGIAEMKSKAMAFYGRRLAIPPPLFTENLKKNQTVIQMIADDGRTSRNTDVTMKHPAKRFKKSSSEPYALHKIDGDSSNFSVAHRTTTFNKIKFCHRSSNRNITKGSFSKDHEKRSKSEGQRSQGQTKVKVCKDDEQDDLMQSYLQARSKNENSSDSSLWEAMQSQKW